MLYEFQKKTRNLRHFFFFSFSVLLSKCPIKMFIRSQYRHSYIHQSLEVLWNINKKPYGKLYSGTIYEKEEEKIRHKKKLLFWIGRSFCRYYTIDRSFISLTEMWINSLFRCLFFSLSLSYGQTTYYLTTFVCP